jgi:hypothetical protein
VDDRMAIDILDTSHDAFLELLLGRYPDVAQDRTGELGEEALDEVEPGAVLGCEGELEATIRSRGGCKTAAARSRSQSSPRYQPKSLSLSRFITRALEPAAKSP